MQVHQNAAEPWRVTLVDTGPETQTGGRLKRVGEHIGDETFMLTYGDGVADIDIRKLFEFHRAHGKQATITAVQPLGRFGSLEIDDDETVEGVVAPGVRAFQEKPVGDGAWVNGGFFVLEPAVLDRIARDETSSSVSRSRAWPPTASWWPSDTPGSGSRWTPCGTSVRCRPSGSRATPRGLCGRASDAASSRTQLASPPTGRSDRAPFVGRSHTICSMQQRFEDFAAGSITDAYDVVACRTCGMCFASGLPDQTRFSEYYGESSKYDMSADGARSPTFDAKRYEDGARFIADHVADRAGPILDIGTATGASSSRSANSVSRAFTASSHRLKPPARRGTHTVST